MTMLDEEHPSLQKPLNTLTDFSPAISKTAFSCPHCGVYSHQFWYEVFAKGMGKDDPRIIRINDLKVYEKIDEFAEDQKDEIREVDEKYESGKVFFGGDSRTQYNLRPAKNVHLSACFTCEEVSVWVHDRLVFPPQRTGPEPNKDIPEEIKATYQEARSIVQLSPRGATALLRLCIHYLCKHLGKKGNRIDDDIASLVGDGLDWRVQKALDIVRVIGNNAVHPGQIDLKDDRETATQLFTLVNLIADKMISEPKSVNEMYEALPEGAKKAIERRDKETR